MRTVTESGLSDGERLKRLVIEILLIDDNEYQDAYGPDELPGWDSLASVTLASAIEREFELAVTPDDIASFNTIGDIRQFCRLRGRDV